MIKECIIYWYTIRPTMKTALVGRHLVLAYIDRVPVGAKDAERVERAFEEDRKWETR